MSDPELTPDQDEQVRRLLAEARHDEPMPVDVAARLDDVLADLRHDAPAPVIDLAARRRRRNAAALLAGAAAAIVAVFGVGQVVDLGGSGSDDAGGGSTAADAPVDRDESAAGSDDFAGGSSGSPDSNQLRAEAPLDLTSANLEDEVRDQLPDLTDGSANDSQAAAPEASAAPACASAEAAFGLGTFFPAYYDGVPAVLALRPPSGATQRADVLACDTGAELDSVEVPVQSP